MDPAWIEWLGAVARWTFYVLVGGLTAAALERLYSRHASQDAAASENRDRASAPRGTLRQVLFEYVANVEVETPPHIAIPPPDAGWIASGPADALCAEVSRAMDSRQVPPHEKHRFLADLERAIRLEEQLARDDNGEGNAERRYVVTQRWSLAERFHTLVADPPGEIVERIRGASAAEPVGEGHPRET